MKADEIQELFRKDPYKFISLNGAAFILYQEEGDEHQQITLLHTGIELDTSAWCLFKPGAVKYGSHCPEFYSKIVANFWLLPTQNQLQDMVFNATKERACDFLDKLHKWAGRDLDCKRDNVSMEELTLLYVMETLFHKRWNEEEKKFEIPKCKVCQRGNDEVYVYPEVNKCQACWHRG